MKIYISKMNDTTENLNECEVKKNEKQKTVMLEEIKDNGMQ